MAKPKKYETTVYVGTVNGKKVRKHITAASQRELNKKVNAVKNNVQRAKMCLLLHALEIGQISGTGRKNLQVISLILL